MHSSLSSSLGRLIDCFHVFEEPITDPHETQRQKLGQIKKELQEGLEQATERINCLKKVLSESDDPDLNSIAEFGLPSVTSKVYSFMPWIWLTHAN